MRNAHNERIAFMQNVTFDWHYIYANFVWLLQTLKTAMFYLTIMHRDLHLCIWITLTVPYNFGSERTRHTVQDLYIICTHLLTVKNELFLSVLSHSLNLEMQGAIFLIHMYPNDPW